ncbi:peptidylprolyl isomerase [Aldersonia sp. NBC_00410]|uniref:peptidylprolyl isomerase n=1 Tax=Aldersonia sp. NBC_00410 TaxID=2975954 RepID=UPI0022584DC9|nr:peptidylprolyl isomerase [Aldersonia sp. NBC_00410]MCX5045300.1 peptidylprolyl isomerase [Aldersonia sp. NBC_00410]
MPTNEQRRAAAKRKLERQVERRAQKARRRKQLTIAGSIAGVIVVVGAVVGVALLTNGDDSSENTAASASATAENGEFVSENTPGELPEPKAKPDTVNCEYPASAQPAAKPNNPPRTDGIQTSGDDATVSLSVATSQGDLGLTLDNAHAPCTVNSFVSLAGQGYFDGTSCHRMTNSESLRVLQCGDPTATGTGGPGYEFSNEYPTDQYSEQDPGMSSPVPYQRGVLAMANAGPDTNGSQFFIVYGDSQLPPAYTIFGTVDESGMATLDKIAAGGVEGGGQDGKPALPVTLTSVQID